MNAYWRVFRKVGACVCTPTLPWKGHFVRVFSQLSHNDIRHRIVKNPTTQQEEGIINWLAASTPKRIYTGRDKDAATGVLSLLGVDTTILDESFQLRGLTLPNRGYLLAVFGSQGGDCMDEQVSGAIIVHMLIDLILCTQYSHPFCQWPRDDDIYCCNMTKFNSYIIQSTKTKFPDVSMATTGQLFMVQTF